MFGFARRAKPNVQKTKSVCLRKSYNDELVILRHQSTL